ncbi:site-specific DNA-methyltransferase [Sulfurimonas sp.]|uniref:site-specific DNA-methyltransferase n=1 Tax=Sulfurimonas sp. TaxID=2022749 RepID=UPI00286E3EEA|nr:site-specific DNA-methyltransferase [Sulfurimonas sp.]
MNKYKSFTKEQLIAKIKQLESKKYGLVWDSEKEPEKVVLECQNNIPILKKIDDKTIQTDKNKPNNILIEGDNYHALQVLNYTHKGQIDVIYIDPPYNTGNKDFKYNDSFVDKEDGYRHSKWLNFMSKRLKLAHNLLKDSGVIFISIDDNEMAQLKLLCDDIFGEDNFINSITIMSNPRGRQSSKHFAETHEYGLVYAKNVKNITINGEELTESQIKEYNKKDEYGNYREIGLRLRGGRSTAEESPTLHFPLYVHRKNKQIFIEETDNCVEIIPKFENGTLGTWRWSKLKIKKDIAYLIAREVKRGDKKEFDIFQKDYLLEDKTRKVKTTWIEKEINYDQSSREQIELFNEKIFAYAKPLYLLRKISGILANKESVILDFFAGSGTTGHAILDLNQDGGNRQFILCTNNENDICTDVTYPRLSKVINGYTTPKGVAVGGLGGNLDYYKTDLVPTDGISNISDTTREELTNKAGNMIAIKENTHTMLEFNEHYQIFQNETTSKQTAIYFTEDLSHFNELIEKVKAYKIKLYIFSFGKIDKSSYKYLGKNFEIEDIPEPIIEIYKEINKEGVL